MSTDDELRRAIRDAIEPVDAPAGLADELIARAAAGPTSPFPSGPGFLRRLLPVVAVTVVAGAGLGTALGWSAGEPPSGTVGVAAGAQAVTSYACPGSVEVGSLQRGDRVLIIGRSGSWLAVRNVRGTNERVFVAAAAVAADDELGSLPEQNCDDTGIQRATNADDAPEPTTVVTTAPSSSTTTTVDAQLPTSTTTAPPSTTTAPTTAPTTTSTTTTAPTTTTTTSTTSTTTTVPPPDTTTPLLTAAGTSADPIWEQDGLGISCPAGTARQSTISVTATDDVGVSSVTATWTDPDGPRSRPMTRTGDVYRTTIGPYAPGAWDPTSTAPFDHAIAITVTALDEAGNEATTQLSVTVREIGDCFV